MNDRQLELIMQIIREQMNDYLDDDMTETIANAIEEGINDNMYTLVQLA